MRNVLATIVGLIIASVVTYLFENLGTLIFPLPEGSNPYDMEWLKNNLDKIPTGAMVFVALAHSIGIALGMFVAGLISKTSMIPAYIVGGLMLIATVANQIMLPHPTWFLALDLLAALIGFIIGKNLSSNKITAS